MSDYAVDIEYLRKQYKGGVIALDGVSLQVPYGCVFGLIGPNGAGKSTLVKSLLTILRPTECRGTMLGEKIGKKSVLKQVGYLPEHVLFPEYLTGRQVIEYSAGLANLPHSMYRSRVDLLLEKVSMTAAADRPIGSYSKGMKQRIGLAQSLINDPKVVFLDEPTDGVDPEGRLDFKKLIVQMRDEGRTVFVNSHLLAEVEQVADRVAILNKGFIVRQGTVADLTRSEARYEILTEGEIPSTILDWCREKGITVKLGRFQVLAESPLAVQPLIDKLRSALIVIREIKEERSSLEEVFLQTVVAARNQNHPPALPKGAAL